MLVVTSDRKFAALTLGAPFIQQQAAYSLAQLLSPAQLLSLPRIEQACWSCAIALSREARVSS